MIVVKLQGNKMLYKWVKGITREIKITATQGRKKEHSGMPGCRRDEG